MHFSSYFILLLLSPSFLLANFCFVEEQLILPQELAMDAMPGSLVETDSGEILATWYGGFGSGACNVDMNEVGIWLSRYFEGKWTLPELIHFEKELRSWNPVLFKTASRKMILFYKVGQDPRQWLTLLRRSSDNGVTWTEPEMLPAGIFGPSKSHPKLLTDGSWIFPSSQSRGDPANKWKCTACWIESTKDAGITWKKIGPITIPGKPFSLTEPCLIQDSNGNFKVFCRNRSRKVNEQGYIWSTTYFPQSETFSTPEDTSLANPDSGIDGLRLSTGEMVLVHNASFINRFPLVLSLSNDDGKTWETAYTIEKDPGEFSQPAIIQAHDGKIHILYAWRPENQSKHNLKHIVILSNKAET